MRFQGLKGNEYAESIDLFSIHDYGVRERVRASLSADYEKRTESMIDLYKVLPEIPEKDLLLKDILKRVGVY